ncbi:MAG: Ig-like domain-containing protein [Neisseria sp.]|uniref:Ig-like domain-containing protein n=1 Tax=Neisseria sp. TaxID=192066 RepID=UPI0026DBECDC|nr:Ig-like domain-containing protein [Neisseria sp.]MDO4640979.1 Ig-like domain-containing protein [Neisseria sp.]
MNKYQLKVNRADNSSEEVYTDTKSPTQIEAQNGETFTLYDEQGNLVETLSHKEGNDLILSTPKDNLPVAKIKDYYQYHTDFVNGETAVMPLDRQPILASEVGIGTKTAIGAGVLLGIGAIAAAASGSGSNGNGKANKVTLKLDNITTDNALNVTEAKSAVTVSGTAQGAAQGDMVQISVNGNHYQAKVAADKTFSVHVAASDLINDSKQTISAGIEGKADTINHSYGVQNELVAKIDLNDITGRHDVISLIGEDNTVTISGKVSATNQTLQQYLHNGLISGFEMNTGDQVYHVTVNQSDGSFSFKANIDDLAKAADNPLSFVYNTNSIEFVQQDGTQYNLHYGIPLDANLSEVQIIFDDNSVLNTLSDNTSDLLETEITGNVSGNAKVGDSVVVTVNGTPYQTTVKSGNTFEVKVKNSDLYSDADHTIEAVLTTKNHAGQTISVSDTDNYAVKQTPDGQNQGEAGNRELPYFIKSLADGSFIEKGLPFGYLNNSFNWQGPGHSLIATYAFAPASNTDRYGSKLNGGMAFSEQQKTDIRALLNVYSKYADISLIETANSKSANLVLYRDDLTSTEQIPGDSSDTLGYAYPGSDVHLSTKWFTTDDAFSFYSASITVLHEVLHSFGFAHPFNEDSSQNPNSKASLNKSADLSSYEDETSYTVMSYTSKDVVATKDLRIFDLAALHYNFGVNPNQRSGNDIYTFSKFSPSSSDGSVYIWDGGGTDTFDASGAAKGVTVSLVPGSWNYIGEKSQYFLHQGYEQVNYSTLFGTGNSPIWSVADQEYVETTSKHIYTEGQSFIGYGTQIENLIGSDHNDMLTGNSADNLIEGGAGNDTISGGAGNDTLDGGTGNDTLAGGTGNDVYYVDSGQDRIIESSGGGNDSVYSTVDYALAAHIENLTLLGQTAIRGTGNDLNNRISGNSADNILNGGAGDDIIIGGKGSDTLTGGAGSDTFIFNHVLDGSVDTITDFQTGIDKIGLSSVVFGIQHITDNMLAFGMSNETSATRFVYDKGTLYYDADGSGHQSDAIAFAKLSLENEKSAQNVFTLA